MLENTHRFSRDQQVSDMAILLWMLGNTCIDELETLLYGTDYKHGYLFRPITPFLSKHEKEDTQERRDYLIERMLDILQELGITIEEVASVWIRVEQERVETKEWGKQWK